MTELPPISISQPVYAPRKIKRDEQRQSDKRKPPQHPHPAAQPQPDDVTSPHIDEIA